MKYKLADIIRKDTKMRGMYRGVVENVEDPESAGRVQCRIHGLHSSSDILDDTQTDGIPMEDLPWCQPAIPLTAFGPDGSGLFGVPQVGSHVLIFFENENLINPIYFAALPSKDEWGDGNEPIPTEDNFVFKVHGGHYVEFDSTEGNERIKVYHSTGTQVEIDSTGAITLTGTGDVNITINGNCTVTTTGVINLN